jgi:hypothetical protein
MRFGLAPLDKYMLHTHGNWLLGKYAYRRKRMGRSLLEVMLICLPSVVEDKARIFLCSKLFHYPGIVAPRSQLDQLWRQGRVRKLDICRRSRHILEARRLQECNWS